MATIRGCKSQLTRAINNLQQGLNQYDQVPLDSNGIENEPPNTRPRRIAERKIDLIAAKSRLEDLLLELRTKFQAAVDFAQRAPINPDSIPPIEDIDNHWVEHNGEEIEEEARKALSVIKATYRQLEIQYHIGSPHSVPPTTQIRREAAAAPDTPPPGLENTPRRILSSTNAVLNPPQEFSQPQSMHNGSVSPQQIDPTMILPSQLQKLEIEPYYGDIARFSEFWCCFDTLVFSNVNIPIAAKFQHLKRALKGDAALVLRGFLTTPENYPRVIKLLHKRYNRPHYARSLIYRQLKELPHASASANSQQKTRHELAKRQHASGTTWNLEQLIEGLEAVVEELEAIDDYQNAVVLHRLDLIQKYAAFAARRTTPPTDVAVIFLYDSVAAFKDIPVVIVECKVVSVAVEITTFLSVITGTADVIRQVHFLALLMQETIEDRVERSIGCLAADILQESRPTMVTGPVIHHSIVVVVLTIDIDRGPEVADAHPSMLRIVFHQILVEYHLQIQSGTNPH
ncbi:hypothetical protein ANCDUO_04312 [Ancylostoma duodenale]|uniref:Uncharacterized protein n=1 Tax=Ancylostoma duodenale TaxID=51022 RepID=A0A0C2D6X6_9BILA|nr:hypothetical protein ANCDUO_04312 [Ancylostoma duodenale]